MKLVTYIINKYFTVGEDDFDDLFQEGCLGLVKAADSFDPELGFAFSTYAGSTIIGRLRTYKRKKCASYHGLKLPRSWLDENYHTHRELTDFSEECSEDNETSRLSFLSCDQLMNFSGNDSILVGDTIADPANRYADVETTINLCQAVKEAKLSVTERLLAEQMIADWLSLGEIKTQNEYAREFNCSQATISRTKKKLASKLNS